MAFFGSAEKLGVTCVGVNEIFASSCGSRFNMGERLQSSKVLIDQNNELDEIKSLFDKWNNKVTDDNIPNFLLEVRVMREKISTYDEYPFSQPIIKNLKKITFNSAVTFIIGENGTGKSTILEAIATSWGFNPEGGTKNFNFTTHPSHSILHKYIRLIKGHKRPTDGFFFRSESFYNVASNIDQLDEDPSFGPPIKNSYGKKSLHQQSHGESFFSLIINRLNGNGLYIFDEPEAALSPTHQIAILSCLHQLVQKKSQFIIATHSPIIMTYPNSQLLEISGGILKKTTYKETEHYLVTKNFLNNPERYLNKLTSDV